MPFPKPNNGHHWHKQRAARIARQAAYYEERMERAAILRAHARTSLSGTCRDAFNWAAASVEDSATKPEELYPNASR